MTTSPPPMVDLAAAPDEATALVQFLDAQRTVLIRKAWNLDHDQLHTTLPPSTLTIGGLLKHLALVEDDWFDHIFAGRPEREPWASAPWDEDRDWELTTARDDPPDVLLGLHRDACDRSRETVASAGSLDQMSELTQPDGFRPSLRWIMLHMIEEYARHCGHADMIRQSIDGATGD
jgi:uncharacterized damage-inducible protein DinB